MSDERIASLPDRMAAIADDFLAALDRQGRGCAQLPFTDEDERTRWFYTPVLRAGLPLRDMDPAQQRLAHRLLALGLSAPGYVTASTIIGLENTLDAEEGFVRDWYEGRGRDPQMYYLSVFGDPGAPRWGWRFEGHHVSVHYTIVDGVIATPTPLFFGADPAESAMLGADVLRPLAGATDLAREVMHALDEEQRAAATLSPIAPPDIMLTNHSRIAEGLQPRPTFTMMDVEVTPERLRRDEEARRASGLTPELEDALVYRARPRGLPVAGMTIAQRDIVAELIGQYVGRLARRAGRHRVGPAGRRRHRRGALRLGRRVGAAPAALLPPARAALPGRVRLRAARRQPHPLGLARPRGRLRPRRAGPSLRRLALTPARHAAAPRPPRRAKLSAGVTDARRAPHASHRAHVPLPSPYSLGSLHRAARRDGRRRLRW